MPRRTRSKSGASGARGAKSGASGARGARSGASEARGAKSRASGARGAKSRASGARGAKSSPAAPGESPHEQARGPSRWPLLLVLLGAATFLAGLATARYVESKNFLYGLVLAGAGLGLVASGLLAFALGRRLFNPGTAGLAGAALGLAAAGLRVVLILARPAPRPGVPTPPVLMWREILVGVPLALAAAALLLGAHVGLRTINLPPGALKAGRPRLDLIGSVVALAGALYTFGPVFRSLGLPVNHVTFLGLVLLGLLAFALASALEWVFGLRRSDKRR